MTNPSSPGTRHIGVRPATNLFHAIRFAADRGRPLTHAVTINWDRLGLTDAAAMAAFRLLRQKVKRRWTYLLRTAARDLGTFDDAGVHENPAGHRNTHWLVRMPPAQIRAFERDVTRFLQKVTGEKNLGRSLHFKPITAVGSFAKYLTKGVDPAYASYFHMEAIDQGFVEGRGRTFVSRSIGFSARKNAGWKRKRRPRQVDNRESILTR